MDLLSKLKELKEHHTNLQEQLGAPDATSDMDKFTKLNKDYAALTPVVEAYESYKKMVDDKADAEEILADAEADAEMKEFAEMELSNLRTKIPQAEEQLKIQLLPKDEADDKDIILEIRAGTGGDEAAIFVGDIFRMYTLYAQKRGWKVDIQEESPAATGGYKEVIAQITGDNVYQQLKYESGVHRVQRVPETESQGRIHTSAITVAVLPEAEEVELNIEPKDLRIDIFRASGPGGQSVNTTDSACRITHIPTGIVAQCQDQKSQLKNKEKAMKVLMARIYDAERQKMDDERSDARRSQVGSGDRSERIRTYNYPQSRVTDHRINLTLHSLHAIMAGEDLDDVIDPLIQADQAAKLAALSH